MLRREFADPQDTGPFPKIRRARAIFSMDDFVRSRFFGMARLFQPDRKETRAQRGKGFFATEDSRSTLCLNFSIP